MDEEGKNINITLPETVTIRAKNIIFEATESITYTAGMHISIKDPLTIGGNIISRQTICYNVGYIYSLDWYEFYKNKNWRYREEKNEDTEFREKAAHQIGHEILKKYGGTIYSYGHKGTVNPVLQH